jgi:O-antigen/teichoic acid export membrane protein
MRLNQLLTRVLSHQGFQRYFANTSWVFAEQILRLGAELLVGIWVARFLGAEQFGILSYAIAFVAIFSTIAKLGLDSIVVRELVIEPSQKGKYLGTAFWLKFGGAFISIAIVVVALQLTSNNYTTKLYILIIACGMIFQSFEVVAFYFQSQVQAKYISSGKLIQLLLSSLLKIYLVCVDSDLKWFVFVSLVDQITLAAAYFIVYRRHQSESFIQYFDYTIAKQLIRNSWPLIFSGLAAMIYMRIDQVMIKEMLGDREVGIYSVAVRLSEVWYFIPMVITNSLFPSVINARKASHELYNVRLQRLYTFMVCIAVAVAVPTTFLSDWLVAILYGEAYQGAGKILKIHVWAGVFVFLGVASSAWLTSENLQRYAFYRTFAGAVINVVLNLLLIPSYGILGAVIATVIAQVVAAFALDLFTEKTRIMFYMKVKAFNPTYILRRT